MTQFSLHNPNFPHRHIAIRSMCKSRKIHIKHSCNRLALPASFTKLSTPHSLWVVKAEKNQSAGFVFPSKDTPYIFFFNKTKKSLIITKQVKRSKLCKLVRKCAKVFFSEGLVFVSKHEAGTNHNKVSELLASPCETMQMQWFPSLGW